MEFILNHFLGTLVNFALVFVVGVLGTLLKRGIPKRFSDIIMSAMAVCVIYIGIDGILGDAPAVAEGSFLNPGLLKVLVMIISMAIGTIIGELIDIDKQLTRLANLLGRLFKRVTEKKDCKGCDIEACEAEGECSCECIEDTAPKDRGARFAEGFVSCSLLFCVGAMAINGAMLDGQGQPYMLLAKTVIDCVSCFVMASTLGIGCAFSAFAVLIYQGIFNFVGIFLAEALAASTIAYMSAVGSLIIILIGTNVLGATKVKTANMVPAMFMPILIEPLLRLIFSA
ncbi:MAG: DUF554 domain-containing protein [Clostridia bacterium]|nr:DUF554 domain-containing protein [Clostridia bacterium]